MQPLVQWGGALRLESNGTNVGFYATSDSKDVDTHLLKLGYFTCTKSYDNLVLLVTSSFFGAQHGSTDVITVYQDGNGNSPINCKLTRVRLGHSDRTFYYVKDTANLRIYLYAYVTGGNSYGQWNISIIQQSQTSWTTDLAKNQTVADSSKNEIPDQLALASHTHECLTNSEIDSMF